MGKALYEKARKWISILAAEFHKPYRGIRDA